MTFVIGDIHGEISKLSSLIDNIYTLTKQAKLIFVGDYLNKGENSKAVLDYLQDLKNASFLMGNHEYYYLQYLKNGDYEKQILEYAESSTFIDFDMNLDTLNEKLYLPYKSFFDNLIFYYETDDYFISHAGIDVEYINHDYSQLSVEKFFKFNRYDFIRLNKKIMSKTVIFGHTGFTHPYYDGVKIGIDTSAVYEKKNPLTAFCLEAKEFINNFGEKVHLDSLDLNLCPMIIKVPPYRLLQTTMSKGFK